ncbi:MAG: OmpA family protein [Lewinellaceae bacterium]|nr:OmpA family protein [Lewinellaceae bacterium]
MKHFFWLLGAFGLLVPGQAVAQREELKPYYIFSIYFGGGSYYIDEGQEQALYEWLDKIPYLDTHEISIHGHTDDIGSLEYNQWLSQNRCDAAWQRLLQNGVRPEQLSIQDFGELNPIYDNRTWEGRRRNRRVDIIVKPIIL